MYRWSPIIRPAWPARHQGCPWIHPYSTSGASSRGRNPLSSGGRIFPTPRQATFSYILIGRLPYPDGAVFIHNSLTQSKHPYTDGRATCTDGAKFQDCPQLDLSGWRSGKGWDERKGSRLSSLNCYGKYKDNMGLMLCPICIRILIRNVIKLDSGSAW